MSIGLLDINDSNLRLWHADQHVQSPGYALLHGQQYLFGTPARAAARLQPRDINTRYWWQLSTDALQPALGPARHTGDLVHAHLRQLHSDAQQPDEVLLAVSGSMQHEQLALLLGIVQQCPFTAVGLVNRSVALGSLYSQGERLFHLEVQLHQAVLSELGGQDSQLALQRTVPLPGCGLLQLQERMVELIAAAFVRQTRFDPRRKAATEQQLYDALPIALQQLQSSAETNLDISGYRARISGHELQAAGKRLFDSVRDSIGVLRPEDQVIADPIAALLPGLTSEIPGLEIVHADDMQRALRAHEAQLVQREQALNFVTHLPRLKQVKNQQENTDSPHASNTTVTTNAAPAAVPVSSPTHFVENHIARRLTAGVFAQGWELFHDDRGWQLRGTGTAPRISGEDYRAGQVLVSGDSVILDGGALAILIEVAP